MAFRKIPYYIAVGALTFCSSVTLGFLSFGGMIAFLTQLLASGIFLPIMPLAMAAFALAMFYEMEIFLQNIIGAIKLLFKDKVLEHILAKEYLLEHLQANLDDTVDCPEFFKDYEKKLRQWGRYAHKILDEDSERDKKAIEKTLKHMERVLADALFTKNYQHKSPYFKDLVLFLKKEKTGKKNHRKEWRLHLETRSRYFKSINWFSLFSGLFAGLGMPFLIADIISKSLFVASIPFGVWVFLIPISMIASGMVTCYSMNKFVNNHTVSKWWDKISKAGADISKVWKGEPWTFKEVVWNLSLITGILTLLTMAFGLTLCAGGTWMSIVEKPAIFSWLTKLPGFIMNIINPLMVVISSGFFNIQNIAETLEVIEKSENPLVTLKNKIALAIQQLKQNENWFQRINPFRIILKLTIIPLRILLFLGHLLSIAATTDRPPEYLLSEVKAFFLSLINELLEDLHYFLKESHSHSEAGHDEACEHHLDDLLHEHLDPSHDHNHDDDIPTKIIKGLFTPLYVLAAFWDCGFSKLNDNALRKKLWLSETTKKKLDFSEALKKQYGTQRVDSGQANVSPDWLKEDVEYCAEKFEAKQFKGLLDNQSVKEFIFLERVKSDVRNPVGDWRERVTRAHESALEFNKNRWFKKSTFEFAKQLPRQVFNCNV